MLEDSEEREPERLELHGQLVIPLREPNLQDEESDEQPGDRRQGAEDQVGNDWEQMPEEIPVGDNRRQAAPGDITERLMAAVEENVIESRGQGLDLTWRDEVYLRDGEEFPIGSDEQRILAENSWAEVLTDGSVERWYERIKERQTGTERLYLGINTPRLRRDERGAHSVVVKLSESGVGNGTADGMDVRSLDRVFQRDARRYDGGLSLL